MSTTQSKAVNLSKAGMDFGIWAEKEGGGTDRDVTNYFPGAMQPARKLAGTVTTGDVTLRKLEADLTDAQLRTLYADQETVDEYACVVQGLAAVNRARGPGTGYRGVIKSVNPANATSGTGADPASIEIVLSVIGTPTIA